MRWERARRKTAIAAGILAAMLLVAAACVALFLDVDRYGRALALDVSRSLGMELTIRGKISVRLLPHPGLTFHDVHLFDGKREVVAAEYLRASPRLFPFIFGGRLVVDRVSLERPKVQLEQGVQYGRRNQDTVTVQDTTTQFSAMRLVAIRHADVTYIDRTSGRSVELGGVDLRLTDLSWGYSPGRRPLALVRTASLLGTLHIATLHIGAFRASGLTCVITAKDGLLRLDPTEITLFGGSAQGSLTLDMSGPTPRIHIVQAASRIELTEVFPVKIFLGTVQASLDVQGTGTDERAIVRTMSGKAAIRSEHVSVTSLDIDGLIADYNRTQNFSLIDLASVVIAGPFAPLVTKGVDFSRLAVFGRMGDAKSEIRRVISDWTIVNGVATTQDVAFATPKNTVAFQGDYDLVNGLYKRFFVATVDQHGCAQVKRAVSGPMAHPRIEGPGSASLGPFKSAFRGAKNLFRSDKCDLFYSGSAIQ